MEYKGPHEYKLELEKILEEIKKEYLIKMDDENFEIQKGKFMCKLSDLCKSFNLFPKKRTEYAKIYDEMSEKYLKLVTPKNLDEITQKDSYEKEPENRYEELNEILRGNGIREIQNLGDQDIF